MSYGSESGVEAVNAHFVGGYTDTTFPNSTQIAMFLDSGYAFLNLCLERAGYDTPAPSGTTAYNVLRRLNDLYAAACAEEATNLSTAGLAEESRSQRLWRRFETELEVFLSGDLTLSGLLKSGSAPPRRSMRALPMRKRDGFAEHFDPSNTEYASSEEGVHMRDEF